MSETTQSGQCASGLVTAASVAVLIVSVLAGVPMGLNAWRDSSMARAQADAKASHLAQAAKYVRDNRYGLAAVGYTRARVDAHRDPAISAASDHLLVLTTVRSPGRLSGTAADEVEYIVDRALASSSPPPHVEYYLAARGALLARRGDVEGSLNAFKASVAKAPDFAQARYFLGKVLADTRRGAEALPELNKAIELDASNGLALKRLARLRANEGDLDASTLLLKRAIALGSDADAHFLMGKVLARQKKNNDALDQFVQASKIEPKYPRIGQHLGMALYRLKRYEEAAKLLSREFEQTRDIGIYYFIGRSMVELRKPNRAAVIFQTIVSNQPTHAMARFGLARLLDADGQAAKARGHYKAFLKLARKVDELADQVRHAQSRVQEIEESGELGAAKGKRGKRR
jgi:tetratricopeptide (TPR) repeat protein